jgi:hypothetical protein
LPRFFPVNLSQNITTPKTTKAPAIGRIFFMLNLLPESVVESVVVSVGVVLLPPPPPPLLGAVNETNFVANGTIRK